MIPYGRQSIIKEDLLAVEEVLKSDFLTQGPMVPKFEAAVKERVGVKHAVAANSATAALHIACLALGLTKEEFLWTVPNTFVASANCGLYCGAHIDFVDIAPSTGNICTDKLEQKLIEAEIKGKLPKILVSVHFSGQPTDQEKIWALSQKYGFRVIEDASHALGASRNGEPVGSCRWSDITVFSFHPVKIITTGEGGMALTKCDDLAWKMQMFRSHGITRDADKFATSNSIESDTQRDYFPSSCYYEQLVLGYNYRLTDLGAALGLSQFNRLDEIIDKRNELAKIYDIKLKNFPVKLPSISDENISAFHLYVVRIDCESSKKTYKEIFNELRCNGVSVNLHYLPVHLQPIYRQMGFSEGQFPEAELHSREAITLPLYPELSNADQDHVISALRKAL